MELFMSTQKFRVCYARKDGVGEAKCGNWNKSRAVIESWANKMNAKYPDLHHWVDSNW